MFGKKLGLTGRAWGGLLKWAGYLVYAMAAVYFDAVFLSMLSVMFPDGLLGALAFAGALATGLSVLLLPLVKMYWVRPGPQMVAAFVFWGVELLVMGLNATLAWQEAQGMVEPLLQMWKYYAAPATPAVVLVGWAALMATDPQQRLRDAQHELEVEIVERLRAQYEKALEDGRVYETLVEGALAQARQMAEEMAQVRLVLPRPGLNGREPERVAQKGDGSGPS